MKSCDLQKIPGGTSCIALRPISSSPESIVLFSCANPPNFPDGLELQGDQKLVFPSELPQKSVT